MKKVIILGGAGFIGLNIARYLIKNRNYKITIADNLSRGKMDSYMKEILSNENSLKKYKLGAIENAKEFDIKAILPKYEKLYADCIKNYLIN